MSLWHPCWGLLPLPWLTALSVAIVQQGWSRLWKSAASLPLAKGPHLIWSVVSWRMSRIGEASSTEKLRLWHCLGKLWTGRLIRDLMESLRGWDNYKQFYKLSTYPELTRGWVHAQQKPERPWATHTSPASGNVQRKHKRAWVKVKARASLKTAWSLYSPAHT